MNEKYNGNLNWVIPISVLILIAIALFLQTYYSGVVLISEIKEDIVKNKIEKIINKNDYDITVSLVKAKLLTSGSSGSRLNNHHTKYWKYKLIESKQKIILLGNDASGEKGEIYDILKLEYFSNNKKSIVQYRALTWEEKNSSILYLNKKKIACIHNSDYSDVVLIKNISDYSEEHFYSQNIDGLNANDNTGLNKFINSNEDKLENYTYVTDNGPSMMDGLYLNNFEKLAQYESEYGKCQIINQQVDGYTYRRKFSNNQKREKTISEKELVTDEYTYYYTEDDKQYTLNKYILYLEHPIEFLETSFDINKPLGTQASTNKIMYNGIVISMMTNSKDSITDSEFIELCKKMIPEKEEK